VSLPLEVGFASTAIAVLLLGLVGCRTALGLGLLVFWCIGAGSLLAVLWLAGFAGTAGIAAILCALTACVLASTSVLLPEVHFVLLLALLGQLSLIGASDIATCYVGLELPNFGAVVLCALHARCRAAVEGALLYLLQSAFSSGLLVLGLAALYACTGHVDWSGLGLDMLGDAVLGLIFFTLGLVWKLGTAPVHAWLVSVLGSIWAPAALYVSVVPKLAVLWLWQCASAGLGWVGLASLFLASLAAMGQLLSKPILAYSAIAGNGLILLALDSHDDFAIWGGLAWYFCATVVVWPMLADPYALLSLDSARALCFWLAALALGGLPPLAGFVGKVAVFGALGLSQAHLLTAAVPASLFLVCCYSLIVTLAAMVDTGSVLTQRCSWPVSGYFAPAKHASAAPGQFRAF